LVKWGVVAAPKAEKFARIEPVPSTFRAFLLLLHTAATDPAVHAAPHVQELTETGIFGRRDEHGNALAGAYFDTRPAGTKTTIVRRKLDEHDRLFHLIPALGASSAACN